MSRLLAVLVIGLTAGGAVADIPPPAPPKGKKYVDVSSELKVAKGVTGYVFVLQEGYGPGRPTFNYKRIEPTADKAVAIPGGGDKYAYVSVFAVPEEAAKAFKTDEELFAALSPNKVKGAHSIGFATADLVSNKVEGTSVKRTYTIEAIDAKGVKKKIEGEGYEPPAAPKKDEKPPQEDEESAPDGEDGPVVMCGTEPPSEVRGGTLIAGAAAGAALTLGGFWVVGRTRRKV